MACSDGLARRLERESPSLEIGARVHAQKRHRQTRTANLESAWTTSGQVQAREEELLFDTRQRRP